MVKFNRSDERKALRILEKNYYNTQSVYSKGITMKKSNISISKLLEILDGNSSI